MKCFQNGRAVYLIAVIGLCLVIGTVIWGYLSYKKPPQGFTPEEITDTTDLVNINTASAEELAMLPGLTEQQAQSIVDYREDNGGFTAAEELMNVRGIGKKTYEKVVLYITTE